MVEAITIPRAKYFASASAASRAFCERPKVTAVLEASPPSTPVTATPCRAPSNRMSTYPIMLTAEIRTTIHQIKRGFKT